MTYLSLSLSQELDPNGLSYLHRKWIQIYIQTLTDRKNKHSILILLMKNLFVLHLIARDGAENID